MEASVSTNVANIPQIVQTTRQRIPICRLFMVDFANGACFQADRLPGAPLTMTAPES
jgi:hypothetical protein